MARRQRRARAREFQLPATTALVAAARGIGGPSAPIPRFKSFANKAHCARARYEIIHRPICPVLGSAPVNYTLRGQARANVREASRELRRVSRAAAIRGRPPDAVRGSPIPKRTFSAAPRPCSIRSKLIKARPATASRDVQLLRSSRTSSGSSAKSDCTSGIAELDPSEREIAAEAELSGKKTNCLRR